MNLLSALAIRIGRLLSSSGLQLFLHVLKIQVLLVKHLLIYSLLSGLLGSSCKSHQPRWTYLSARQYINATCMTLSLFHALVDSTLRRKIWQNLMWTYLCLYVPKTISLTNWKFLIFWDRPSKLKRGSNREISNSQAKTNLTLQVVSLYQSRKFTLNMWQCNLLVP